MRRYLAIIGLITVVIAAFWLSRLLVLPADIGATDFIQYWSGARAVLQGENPYDSLVLAAIQTQAFPLLPEVTRMWNPPAILSVALPWGLLPFEQARTLWFLFLLALVVISFFKLCSLFDLSSAERRLGMVLVAASASVHNSFAYGQLSPLLLAGWIGFLAFQRNHPLSSGITLSLTLLKPHLLFLPYLTLVRFRAIRVLGGMLLGFAVLSVVSMLLDSLVWSRYLSAFKEPPFYWFNPSLGAWSQFLIAGNAADGTVLAAARFLPALSGMIVWLLLTRHVRQNSMAIMLQAVPWSLALNPYGWTYDQILLIPTELFLLQSFMRHGQIFRTGLLLAATFVLALTPGALGQQYSVWFPLFIGVLCCVERKNQWADLQVLPP